MNSSEMSFLMSAAQLELYLKHVTGLGVFSSSTQLQTTGDSGHPRQSRPCKEDRA
jgi:hypothetical protein